MEDTLNRLMKEKLNFANLERLSLIEKVDLWYNSVQPFCVRFRSNIERVPTKSSEKALEYKKSGNDLFGRGELIEALKYYTKSAAAAPPGSPELAVAYGNRSAALYRLQRYKACLVDINRALKENHPEASKPKLRDRQKNCLSKLQELEMATKIRLKSFELMTLDDDTLNANLRFHLKECEINLNSTDMNYEERFYLPKVNFENKTISNATKKVGLKFSSEFGRHVVALEDIKPGEIIAIEKPYASILSFSEKYSHCANCFVRCESLIPCSNCSSVLFCSKRCLQNAYSSFHRIECQILSLPGCDDVETDFDWLVIRLLMMVTKQGKEIEPLMRHPVFKNPLKKHIDELPNRIESQDYYNIHNLEDHLDKRVDSTLFLLVYNVAKYVHILKNTTFFDEQCEENKFSLKEKERYSSHLLLKFISSIFNSFAIIEGFESQVFPPPPPPTVQRLPGIGSALFSFHSSFNHACNGNVCETFHKDTIVTRSVDPINAGEQLFLNYGTSYEYEVRDKRQKYLREIYFFTCCCTPCKENWPLLKNFVSVKSEIIKFKELNRCSKAVEEQFAPGVPKYQHSEKLFSLLCKYLTLLHENTKKPNHEYYECQQRLMRMLMARGNYYELARDRVLISL